MDASFRMSNGTIEVSPCAAGPWRRDLQHGGAPAGLIASALIARRVKRRCGSSVPRKTCARSDPPAGFHQKSLSRGADANQSTRGQPQRALASPPSGPFRTRCLSLVIEKRKS